MNDLSHIAMDMALKTGPFNHVRFLKGRSSTPIVIPPKFVMAEDAEMDAQFLGAKAGVVAATEFAKRFFRTGYWTGDSDRAIIVGRETYDAALDADPDDTLLMAQPFDLIVPRSRGRSRVVEFLAATGVLYNEPDAIIGELDIEIVYKPEANTMQLNMWLDFEANPEMGRFVA